MKSFRFFAVAAAVTVFALAVLGSWVRINGAGMTCPDWPLCRGSLIPTLEGGVILEWSHRLVALILGFVVAGAVITGFRSRREVAGVTPVLGILGIIFIAQVALGGLTVRLSNRPDSVVWHWGVGMCLLAALTALAVLSVLRPTRLPKVDRVTLAASAAAAGSFIAMCAGAFVSSSGAGLACAHFPQCGAGEFWGSSPLQTAQMIHRAAAVGFAGIAAWATYAASRYPGAARNFGITGLALTGVQIALGIGNVYLQLPMVLREAHAANAVLTFLSYVLCAMTSAVATGNDGARIAVLLGDTVPTTTTTTAAGLRRAAK